MHHYGTTTPFKITLSIKLLPKLYGNEANELIGLVRNTFATFPFVILPWVERSSNAYDVLIVAALIASSGVIFILMHAREIANDMFPLGALPGLKSEAIANGNPASSICRAGGNDKLRKNAAPGNAVGIVDVPFKIS